MLYLIASHLVCVRPLFGNRLFIAAHALNFTTSVTKIFVTRKNHGHTRRALTSRGAYGRIGVQSGTGKIQFSESAVCKNP